MAEPTEEREFKTSSCVHGYHVYQAIRSPFISEQLNCRREPVIHEIVTL